MPKIILKGTPASIGVIEGKVKVVNDPYTHNFKKGDIKEKSDIGISFEELLLFLLPVLSTPETV